MIADSLGSSRTARRKQAEQIPIAQARAELTQLPERLSAENRTVALTRYGEPVLPVMPWDLFESIVETLEVMADMDMMGRPAKRH